MKIGIASDHRGYELKSKIIENLSNKYEFIDYGTNSNESVDYPLYAKKLCDHINEFDKGILICGTGTGISIAANKVKGIRCGKVINKEEAFLAASHNNANVISFGENTEDYLEIVETYINTPFSNMESHTRRVNQINEIENA